MMESHQLELRYLRYFIVMAETLNFRQAAERLHISPSALTTIVKKLEDILGTRLCERTTAKVRLTAAGNVFLAEAYKLLAAAQAAADVTKRAALGDRGQLRIAMYGRVNRHVIHDALELYQKEFPEVEIHWVDTNKIDTSQAFSQWQVDVACIPVLLPVRAEPGISFCIMMELPLQAAMRANHPLTAQKKVTLAEMAEWPVLLPAEEYLRKSLAAIFYKKKLKPMFKVVSSFETALAMLSTVNCVTLMAKAYEPPLVLRPLAGVTPVPRGQMRVIWRKTEASQQTLDFVKYLPQFAMRCE